MERKNFRAGDIPLRTDNPAWSTTGDRDGGQLFNSAEWKLFLKKWGIRHRLSSAGYPQSNVRAELAVKMAKRVLFDNVTPSGTLDRDAVVRAFLQYKNTPVLGLAESPAQII